MEKVQVEILSDGLRLDGIDLKAGETVILPKYLLNAWKEKGYCKEKEDETKPPVEPPKNPEPPKEPELNHVGGGYYLLPNGEKVHGKAAAIEAMKALKGGDKDGIETNNSTDSGAGNNTGSGN